MCFLKAFKVIARDLGPNWKDLQDRDKVHINSGLRSMDHLFVSVHPIRAHTLKRIIEIIGSNEYP